MKLTQLLAAVTFTAIVSAQTTTTTPTTTVASAATTTKSCNPIKTYHANFDNLPVGASPTTGFAGCGWPGFTVSSDLPYAGIKPASANNSILANGPETGYFYSSVGVIFELSAFSFACTASIPGENSYFASSCDIMIVGVPDTPIQSITSFGPFTFTANFTALQEGIYQKMERVKLNAQSSYFYFFVTSAAAGSRLYLDSMVVEQQNYCPS